MICGGQTGGELLCWQYEVWARDDRACAVDTDGCLACWPGDWGWGEGKRICTEDVEPPIKGGGTDPG